MRADRWSLSSAPTTTYPATTRLPYSLSIRTTSTTSKSGFERVRVRDKEYRRPGKAENSKGRKGLPQLGSRLTTSARRALYLVNFPHLFSSHSFTMSTSYDKVVKLACKPKAAPPKPKVCSLHVRGTACIVTPVFRSTSTPSLLRPGPKTAPSMTSAKPSRRAFASPMPSYAPPRRPPARHR